GVSGAAVCYHRRRPRGGSAAGPRPRVTDRRACALVRSGRTGRTAAGVFGGRCLSLPHTAGGPERRGTGAGDYRGGPLRRGRGGGAAWGGRRDRDPRTYGPAVRPGRCRCRRHGGWALAPRPSLAPEARPERGGRVAV